MIVSTETKVSRLEQLTWHPLSKLRIEFLKMEDWLRVEGHTILEFYSYEDFESFHTVIGIKSEVELLS